MRVATAAEVREWAVKRDLAPKKAGRLPVLAIYRFNAEHEGEAVYLTYHQILGLVSAAEREKRGKEID